MAQSDLKIIQHIKKTIYW